MNLVIQSGSISQEKEMEIAMHTAVDSGTSCTTIFSDTVNCMHLMRPWITLRHNSAPWSNHISTSPCQTRETSLSYTKKVILFSFSTSITHNLMRITLSAPGGALIISFYMSQTKSDLVDSSDWMELIIYGSQPIHMKLMRDQTTSRFTFHAEPLSFCAHTSTLIHTWWKTKVRFSECQR